MIEILAVYKFPQIKRLWACICITLVHSASSPSILEASDTDFTMSGSRPNIIFFLADDQSRSDHRTYGNEKAPTPITEAFSKEALVFDKAYTGQAICAPSRSMLLTGLYPIRNGCFINHTAIRPGLKSLPSYLKSLGYDVILAGKSHLKPSEQFPWTEWMRPVPKEGYPRPALPLDAIDDYMEKSKQPFCLILASEYPHGPYFKESQFDPNEVVLAPFQYDSPGTRNYASRYYQSIDEKENEFDAILKLIERHGLERDTIVFYADDHGVSRGKFTVYDSGINVAFMVRWPEKIVPGRSDALISFADFVPTALDLASRNSEVINASFFDGKSLVPLLEGKTQQHHEFTYAVSHNQGIQNRHIFPQRAIHDGRYHYIYNFNSNERLSKLSIKDPTLHFFLKFGADKHKDQPEEELYDVGVDPFELNNLAKNPELTAKKIALKKALFKWMKSQNDFLSEEGIPPIFKVWGHQLDENAPRFKYKIPEKMLGTLSGKKVDPHLISRVVID